MKISGYSLIVMLSVCLGSGCGQQSANPKAGIEIVNPQLREPPPGINTTVAYMTLVNHGPNACHLTGGKADFARAIEVHEHSHHDGLMQMRKLDQLTLAPHSETRLEPGGYHLMIFDVNQSLASGKEYSLTLVFSDCPSAMAHAMVKPVTGN